MTILRFPPVERASPEGLLAVGGDLELESLKLAYASGVFPWPNEEFPLLWFAPPRRGVLDFDDFKIPARARRELKNRNYAFKVDHDFSSVIRACAEGKTRKSQGTWINREMVEAYQALHQAGFAHSFECYGADGRLIGGLYGVGLGGMFAAESMFFAESGASKAALIFAVDFLKGRGARWMDIQILSPLLQSFGAKEIPRSEFMCRLQASLGDRNLFREV